MTAVQGHWGSLGHSLRPSLAMRPLPAAIVLRSGNTVYYTLYNPLIKHYTTSPPRQNITMPLQGWAYPPAEQVQGDFELIPSGSLGLLNLLSALPKLRPFLQGTPGPSQRALS